MNENQNQQGDVLLEKVNQLPRGWKKIKPDKRGVVLAEGEHTGHYHGIEQDGVALLECPAGKRYVQNTNEYAVSLTHQEHQPVTIEPGIWEIGGVREHDYFLDMERKVID